MAIKKIHGEVIDASTLEGSNKATVQDHNPKAHTAASHSDIASTGADIDDAVAKKHTDDAAAQIATHADDDDAHHEVFTPTEHTAIGDAAPHHAKYTNGEAVSAAEAAGLALASGKNIKVISALTADQTWSGITAILTAGEDLTIGQACYMKSDGKMWKSLATVVGTMPIVALATGTIAADADGEFLLIGFFREDTVFTFTIGDMLYASEDAAGALKNAAPTTTGEQVQVVGRCFPSIHVVSFNPSLVLAEIA